MKKKFQKLRLEIWRDRELYLFLLLPVIYIIIFAYAPMGGLVIAFKDYSVRKGIFGSDWIGLDNFVRFFESYQSGRIIANTIILSLYEILAGFPIPICFALMLNSLKGDRFKKFSQSVVNLPHFISTTVMVGILYQLLSSRTGLYGMVVEMLTGNYPADLFASANGFRHLYVWSGIWQNFGWGSVIYTAALAGVDPEYHEAAQIDGATRFQRILHIDLPCILPTIIINLILRMGSVMSIGFEKVYLMQNGLNLTTSNIISTYVYQVGLSATGTSDFSFATAVGMFNSCVNLLIITVTNSIARKVGDTSLW
ncbi:MAG: sugar ABC transporter permease [Lachnospiraceae bacterium]|nr:sugar ABC transporter permease [Lachnospiraceae bacterium]